MSNSFIWPIDKTILDATTPGQNGPGSDDHESVICISQSSSITGAFPSDCLMSYPGHSFGGVLPCCRDVVGIFYSSAPPIGQYTELNVKKKTVLFQIIQYSISTQFICQNSSILTDWATFYEYVLHTNDYGILVYIYRFKFSTAFFLFLFFPIGTEKPFSR